MLQIEINRGLGQPCHPSIDRFGSQTDQRGLIALRWTLGFIIGPQHEKTYPRGYANNKGADQPAHPRSLISAFVIPFVESFICKLATCEISIV